VDKLLEVDGSNKMEGPKKRFRGLDHPGIGEKVPFVCKLFSSVACSCTPEGTVFVLAFLTLALRTGPRPADLVTVHGA
jgi:hypothetical protein